MIILEYPNILMVEPLRASIIIRRILLLQMRTNMPPAIDSERTEKTVFSIANSRCAYCSRVIERRLVKTPGIKNVAVSYLTDTVLVRYDPEKTTPGIIRESIKKIGYDSVEQH